MTLDQILQDIANNNYTLDQLRETVSQAAVGVSDATPDAITLLYSGKLNDNLHSGTVAEAISNASMNAGNLKQVVTLADTDAYKVLKSQILNDAIDRATQGLPDAENLRTQFFDGITDANGVRTQPGVWDDISGRFTQAATGDVRTIVAPDALSSSVFGQTELKALLDNPNVTHLDGVPKEQWLLKYNTELERNAGNTAAALEEVRQAVMARSTISAANLTAITDAEGNLTHVGTGKFFAGTHISDIDIPSGVTGDVHTFSNIGKRLPSGALDSLVDAGRLVEKAGVSRMLNKLGIAGDVLCLLLAADNAYAAYEQGDTAGATAIMTNWAGDFAGGLVGGLAAAKLAAMATLPLAAAGPVGAIVAGVIVLGAGFMGGLYGSEGGRWIARNCASLFSRAEAAIMGSDPLVFDLDNDGLETTSLAHAAFFDHDASGFAERTGWIAPDDGLLVMDRNNNTIINDGSELFGDQTILQNGQRATDGYQALAELDTNFDTVINVSDAAWTQLKIWKDTNADGSSSTNELYTLDELGITSIDLSHTDMNITDAQGNTQIQAGTFQKSDGSTGQAGGFILQANPVYSIANEWVDVPLNIASLPDARGFGNVYNLQQAMARDTSGGLWGIVEQFGTTTEIAAREALVDKILYKWTGSDEISPASRGRFIDAKKVAVVEKFMGQDFNGANGSTPDKVSGILLDIAYQGIKEMVYSELMAQTHLKEAYDAITYTWDAVTQTLKADLTQAIETVKDDAEAAAEFIRTIIGNGIDKVVDNFNIIKDFYGDLYKDVETKVQDGLAELHKFFSEKLIMKSLYSIYKVAEWVVWWASPIILDLDKDGVETTNLNAGAYFDHDKSGFAEQTGWVSPDDGILVMDRNGDGIINDGKELFGDQTILKNGQKAANGFLALAELDSNKDGKINANDSSFSNLKIWQDFDGDGYSSADELSTLNELGIQSINTGYTNSTLVDEQGNEHRQVGSFTWSDGTKNTATDVWFQTNTMFTIANEWLDVPEGIAALPDLQGYGNVYDLQQAMVRDTSGGLKALIEQFVAETDPAARTALMEPIMLKWTGSENIDPASRGLYMDARRLVALEKIFGDGFVGQGNPNTSTASAPLLEQIYEGLSEMYYAELISQTHLKPYYDLITYTWDDTTQALKTDLTAVTAGLQNLVTTDPTTGKTVLGEFARTLRGLNSLEMTDYMTFRRNFASLGEDVLLTFDTAGKNLINGTSGNDTLTGNWHADALLGGDGDDTLDGGNSNDVLYGQAGNDILQGGNDDDILFGGAGNDTLYGGEGNDILDGGAGNDFLQGNSGSDTYLFGRGGGQDTIEICDGTVGRVETLRFAPDVTRSDVLIIRSAYNMIFKINGTTDQITVQSWMRSPSFELQRVEFGDGTVLTTQQVVDASVDIYGTASADNLYGSPLADRIWGYEGNDMINGYAGDDLLDGGDGDDSLRGSEGNDTIYGGAGNDTLSGEEGNDILDGGAGNDILSGSTGNDLYLFGRGGGQDTINNIDGSVGHTDILRFGSDVKRSDVTITRSGNNMVFKINGTTDQITVQSWMSDPTYQPERVEFGDGTVLTPQEITDLTTDIYGTSAAETLQGSPLVDRIYGLGGNDTIYGNTGDDFLDGGLGNDTMKGGVGNDTYAVDSTGDVVTENANEGTDTVNSAVTYTLGANVENLTLIGTSAINGTGNTLDNILTGNSGNNVLTGGAGNDTYKFGLGIGTDTVTDAGADTSTQDKVLFNSDVLKETVALFKSGQNLMIGYGNNTINVTSQFQTDYGVEKLELGNGQFLTDADVNQVIQDMTAFASSNGITLTNINDVKNNQDLMTIISNAWHG